MLLRRMTDTVPDDDFVNRVRQSVIDKQNLPYNQILDYCLELLHGFSSGSDRDKQIRGVTAELAIHYMFREFKKYNPQAPCYIHNGVILQKGTIKNVTNEIDTLIITNRRIFVIEVKSYYGNLVVDTTGTIVTAKGLKQDPLKQNEAHCNAVYNNTCEFLPNKQPAYIVPIVCIFSNCTITDKREPMFRAKYPIVTIEHLLNTVIQWLSINIPPIDAAIINNRILQVNLGKTYDGREQHIANCKKGWK